MTYRPGSGVTEQLQRGFLGIAAGIARISRTAIVSVMERSVPTGDEDVSPRTGQVHRASAPGEPPAYGAYARSWRESPAAIAGGVVRAEAYTAATDAEGSLIGVDLEYGTETVEPRPHVRVAIPEIVRESEQLVRRAR